MESDSNKKERDELFIHSANHLEQLWRPEWGGVRLKMRTAQEMHVKQAPVAYQ